MTEEPSKIIPFPALALDEDDTVAEAVREAGRVPPQTGNAERDGRRPVWRAILTFLGIALLALLISALLPLGPNGTVRWPAAFAFVVAVLMGGAALLYRFAREFWR